MTRPLRWLLGNLPALDWQIAVLTVVSTSLLLLDSYHEFTANPYLDRAILYLIVPLLVTLLVFRQNPAQYGLRLGDWRAGLLLTLLAVLIFTPLLLWVARQPEMQAYYRFRFGPRLLLDVTLDLIGWEFLFRGWLLFGYARRFGPEAIWLQAVPFALAHLSKPEIETLSTIFGGFAFGWVAWRTRSYLYPFFIHWYIMTFTVLVAAGIF